MNRWSIISKARLATCHEDLVTLAQQVMIIHDCSVICGHRGRKAQNKAHEEGHSKLTWPRSKHNKWPSQAIDLGPYLPRENVLYDREQVLYFAGIVKATAFMLRKEGKMKYRIRWGGDWDRDNNFKEHSFFDGVHFELIGVE